VVHVAGAVVAPGVYQLPPGSRVADAIAAAGGASATADVDVLNLAAPVADGDRIGVPLAGSGVPAAAGHLHAGTAQSAAGGSAPVNINSASAEQLDELPGIGPATAAAIVSHREQHGPFASVDDLEAVRGIGPAKIEALRAAVVL
jgi:competence protein ComEA